MSAYDSAQLAIIVQAGATVILALSTLVLTRQLIHSPHMAYVRPYEVGYEHSAYLIRVRNFGPGVVRNVRVKIVAQTRRDADALDPSKMFVQLNRVEAQGPLDLGPREEAAYRLDNLVDFERDPLFLAWESVTGRKQKAAYVVNLGLNENRILPLGSIRKVVWWIKWSATQILGPVHVTRRWWRQRLARKDKTRSS